MGLGANMRRVKKFRTLKELYEVTAQVELPKSTLVLDGSCSIRGPMDETEGSDQLNMGLSGTEGQVGRRFASGKCNETEVSGTCNVCTVLCSCCMHFSRVASPVGTKACIMDEAFSGKETSQCSFGDAIVLSHSNSGLSKDTHHTCSETSNLLSSISSQNSVSENADSKAVPRASDMFEVIEKPLKVNSGQAIVGNRDLSKPPVFQGNLVHDKQTELELRCDDISCISRADGTDAMLGDHSADANRTNSSCRSASVNSIPTDLVLSVSHFVVGGRFAEVEVDCRKTPTAFIEGSQPEFSDLSNKLEALEISSLKRFYPGTSSPKGELSKFSEEQVESTLTRGVAVGLCDQIHDVHNGSESLEPAAKIENRESSVEAMNCPHLKVLSGNSCAMLKEPKKQESPLPSQPDINKNSSTDLEVDVKVCDICGDEGQRHMLAVCSKCSDGAEHIYCMFVKLDKVPEGNWICEVCTIKEEKENKNQLKFDKASVLPKRSSLNKMRHNYRGSSILKFDSRSPSNVKHSAAVKGRAIKTGFTSPCSAKRPGVNLEGYLETKRRALETTIGQSSMSRSFQETVLHRDLLHKSLDKGKTKLNSAGSSLNDQSSIVSKPCKGTLPCKDSLSNNSEKRKANNSCEVIKLGDRTSNKNSENTQSHKSPKIESKPQIPKGPLYKSKSFNIADSKVGARLPEQGFPLKQQDAKSGAMGYSRYEGNPRMLNKSKSFNNASSDRFGVSHPTKVRMLSPSVSCSNDGKKLRSAKDQSCQIEQPSKCNEPVARLPVVGSSVSPLTCDRKLVSKAPTLSLHSFGSNSHHARSSNSPQDSNCSLDRKFCRSKYSNGDKQVADNVGQNVEHSTEAAVLAITTNKANANLPTDGSLRKIATGVVFHGSGVFPEPDYIWRGGFELQRSVRLARSYDGIQAHVSSRASPKVLEVVDKLPHRIVMEEVPRLSTWPSQFLETRVTENNIALYFFAKDIESYRRNYKGLLECLMKNDLALKGNVDGIELLIFSSNLLPKESQRWNNLLFLWGVFRARRYESMPNSQVKESIPNLEPMANSEKKTSTPNSEHIPSSQEKISIPCKNSATLENLITPDKEVSICAISDQLGGSLSSSNISCNAKQTSSFVDYLRLPPVSNESEFKICEPNAVAPEQKILGSQANSSQQVRVDTSTQHERLPGDVLHSNTSLRDCKGRLDIDLNSCLPEEFYEEQESMGKKSCCSGMTESNHQSKYSDDGTTFGIHGVGPTFSVEDHKRIGASGIENHDHVESSKVDVKTTHWQVMAAKGKDKMESPSPNRELSLCEENMKESSRHVELSLRDQHPNIVAQNKYNEREECERAASGEEPTPHQHLPDQHRGKTSLSLFGRRFNI